MAASSDIAYKLVTPDNIASFPVAATTTLYRGSMISKVDGYAQALTDGTKFDGHAVAQVKNTTAEGYGTAGDLNVEVLRGKYKMPVTLTGVSEIMVGAAVYAIDDNTYTLAPMMTPVGRVWQYVASNTAIVEFDTDICRQKLQASGIYGHFLPFFTNIVDGNVETNNSGVAKIWTRTSVNGPGIIKCINKAAAIGSPYCNGISIVADTAENDGESLQMSGEMFYLSAATRPVFFGCRITLVDADACDTLVGLSITDTSILDGVTDSILFRSVDATAAWKLYVEKDSTETASASAVSEPEDNTAVTLGFIYNGTYVTPYVEGVAGTALAVTNLPDNEGLTLTIEHIAGKATDTGIIINFCDVYQLI